MHCHCICSPSALFESNNSFYHRRARSYKHVSHAFFLSFSLSLFLSLSLSLLVFFRKIPQAKIAPRLYHQLIISSHGCSSGGAGKHVGKQKCRRQRKQKNFSGQGQTSGEVTGNALTADEVDQCDKMSTCSSSSSSSSDVVLNPAGPAIAWRRGNQPKRGRGRGRRRCRGRGSSHGLADVPLEKFVSHLSDSSDSESKSGGERQTSFFFFSIRPPTVEKGRTHMEQLAVARNRPVGILLQVSRSVTVDHQAKLTAKNAQDHGIIKGREG